MKFLDVPVDVEQLVQHASRPQFVWAAGAGLALFLLSLILLIGGRGGDAATTVALPPSAADVQAAIARMSN
ncbi:hypothetical protein [Tritonibacter horizontis]|uniref:Uncharacterized protein n=1 Tax=Tritonibacter horizontis TaxID=1768241 RepID=A0A132BZK5_9RHOB|nr:hypothetical protein [Tritonibacter horizontis]KUP93795.1 hypothetical protein TRIHO_12870 [Tritonibacter horizontis]